MGTDAEYHTLIGQFINKFVEIESAIQRRLLEHTGLSKEEYKILRGNNPSLASSVTPLMKLAKIRLSNDEHAYNQMESAREQLNNIKRLRNWIIHKGGWPLIKHENGNASSDRRALIQLNDSERSKETGRSEHIFTYEELNGAIGDLQAILDIVGSALCLQSTPEQRKRSLEFTVGKRTWQYKCPLLKQGDKLQGDNP